MRLRLVSFLSGLLAAVCAALAGVPPATAQPTATLQGHVLDASGAVVPHATIAVQSESTGFDRTVETDDAGRFYIAAIPVGSYTITATVAGFRSELIEEVTFEVGRTVVRDFHLSVAGVSERIDVTSDAPLIDRASSTVGHVIGARAIEEVPLNGRHFTDLLLLVPGSLTASQTGFSTTPARGSGALAISTAGNREEAVAFVVNGVTTNNLTFGSLGFQPPVGSIEQLKVDNSTFSAEYGHVSGAIVTVVTKSGTSDFRGNGFGYVRDDLFDARNFFEQSPEPHRFGRTQFGGSFGGPIVRQRTFFFASYEGLRQRQGLDMNSLVLSDSERAAVTDPTIASLVALIPPANVVDADGTPRFVGAAEAVVDQDRWTIDVRHHAGRRDHVHLFYGSQDLHSVEPAAGGNSIPGFGRIRRAGRSVLTVSETRTVSARLLNEVRFGRSLLGGADRPAAELNPLEYGIQNGVTRTIGLPQIVVAGGLNFGGPASFPVGRDDRFYVVADTVTYLHGRHFLKAGGEFRYFLNENFTEGTGSFNFPTVDAFLAGTANAFAITLGERRNVIAQKAAALFVQNRVALGGRVTLDLGLRYEAHLAPTERDDQFVVFDPATATLRRVGVDTGAVYRDNHNVEPRLGLAWDLSNDGATVVRAAYAWAVDEPGTTAVRDAAGNPPFATPLAAAGTIPITSAVTVVQTTGLAPATIDPNFRNASQRSWNVNLQRQLSHTLGVMVGYFGSQGRNLRISRNINQPIDGVRPFAAVSSSSPIRPGAPLGNITQVESSGFSRYDALWVSATQSAARGLQLNASYTWSKSMDTNSLNSAGFAVQDSYDIPGQYGLSDFDARHRLALTALYALPFDRHPLWGGWHVAVVVQAQSGNPVNIVTGTSSINGTPNSIRPDVNGPVHITGSPGQWFDPSVFRAVNRFGNLDRNAVIGPPFHNTDVSVTKTVPLDGHARLQLRAEVFNLFNYASLGPPGNVVGTPTFGKVVRTRFPTGEGGSSRQLQFAVNLSF